MEGYVWKYPAKLAAKQENVAQSSRTQEEAYLMVHRGAKILYESNTRRQALDPIPPITFGGGLVHSPTVITRCPRHPYTLELQAPKLPVAASAVWKH
ncbi:hypothetical protein STEG23_017309 [Scotinomys teguina]